MRVLAMEATMQETAAKGTSATSRTAGPRGRKTGWSETPNRRVLFL
jgi:hypothetical protein